MEPKNLIEFIGILEKLKCNTRHSWTSSGRHESVAEHSWRLAIMALLLQDDFPNVDMQRVLTMCLVHDWGEAISGDVPAFTKTASDEEDEEKSIKQLVEMLPQKDFYRELFEEIQLRQTPEAKLWRALDMLEALIQHNEADVSTWLPLEHEFQLTYGQAESAEFEYTKQMRKLAEETSRNKSAAVDR